MFLYSKWLSIPITTRTEFAQKFGIQKKNPTHVQDNVIVSDGYLIQDVEQALNIPNLQEFLNTTEDNIDILWDMLISPEKYKVIKQEEVKDDGTFDTDFGIQPLNEVEPVKEVVNVVLKKKGGRPAGSKNK